MFMMYMHIWMYYGTICIDTCNMLVYVCLCVYVHACVNVFVCACVRERMYPRLFAIFNSSPMFLFCSVFVFWDKVSLYLRLAWNSQKSASTYLCLCLLSAVKKKHIPSPSLTILYIGQPTPKISIWDYVYVPIVCLQCLLFFSLFLRQDFITLTRLSLNSQKSTCFCRHSAGIRDVHVWLYLLIKQNNGVGFCSHSNENLFYTVFTRSGDQHS